MTLFFGLMLTVSGYAQSGVSVSESANIKELMEVKKEIAKNEKAYQIQVYNGNISGANEAHATVKSKYGNMPSALTFETPNYKVRLGAFRTRLEAEKQLVEIKKSYPGAFIISFTGN